MPSKNNLPIKSEFLLYESQDGRIRVETRMQDETVWLTINQMAELFQVNKSGISRHLKNIFESGELSKEGTVAFFATVQNEGGRDVSRDLEYYSLDAIISVGYRVNTIRGTQFRIWATERLREYIIKGFAMDDDRLKSAGGGNYFDELLARIRDIRSSEKIFWRKVLDIYATSIDYSPDSEESKLFFATIQNKMHWAAHGHTAAEVIYNRADGEKSNMGMTNWIGPVIRKNEISVAKNYLNDEELNILNRIVTAYLEFAELQALNRKPMYMKDWILKLDDFLKMSGRELLSHAGNISHDQALKKALKEYHAFRKSQLEAPSRAEKDFIEAEQKLKKIESGEKSGKVK
ncbi:MAG TPA: virulence RhuM family protein [Spirochaetota bacterium]|nr:virulence RhuM family protein [Spirochaetota bacterium]HPS85936.1 virulence RhuM family protein [Spirochaetota bacterium]